MGQESLRRLAGNRKSKSSPPILSQEFIIQNHGDIMSCIVMLVFAGFMFQVTSPLAALFVTPQYNQTDNTQIESTKWLYRNGLKDIPTILFYSICAIVGHAVVQEYVLDKLQRKLHLSKTKTSKFTESGHLAVFALYSVLHALYIVNNDGYFPELSKLWSGYPEEHRDMNLHMKVFYLVQLAYWLHVFPEFYFQKAKKDEIRSRSVYTILYIGFISTAYILNFTRVGLLILALHYVSEFLFHLCRMAHFAEKTSFSNSGFKLFNILFVLVRILCITLAVLTFWYGLRSTEVPHVDLAAGNFNTTFIRLNCLLLVCGLQVWFMWNFINFHLKRMREHSPKPRGSVRSNKHQRKVARKQEEELRNLTEADQETTRVLRSAKKKGE